MNNVKQFFLFLMVGSISAIVNFFTFFCTFNLMNLDYRFSVSIAYILSVVVHFIGNRYLTFQSYHQHSFSQIKRYIVLLLINYCLTLAIVTTSVAFLHVSPYIGIALAIAFTVGIGFIISKTYVFKYES